MLDRQWIRVQLPDIKCLSIPIKLTRQPIKSHLVEHEKDLFRDLNDDDEKSQKSDIDPSSKKRKTISIDAADLFLLNPEPIRCHILESNSSTLSLSNAHILIHDNQKLILFDYQKKLNETRWNDNTYGTRTRSTGSIESPFLVLFKEFWSTSVGCRRSVRLFCWPFTQSIFTSHRSRVKLLIRRRKSIWSNPWREHTYSHLSHRSTVTFTSTITKVFISTSIGFRRAYNGTSRDAFPRATVTNQKTSAWEIVDPTDSTCVCR